MIDTIIEKTEVEGKSPTSVGKMWAYFSVWMVVIALGVFCMANCDRAPVNTTATQKVKKNVTRTTAAEDQRLAKK
ncbi:hypothetical protein [uncultured Microscilla sp.]|uniref:hypothetical protein n=1 Tax=uncultured Microscilla sp. TaxID=432653 RepID=UPI00262E2979|nr:hypothetical protein [uncultured Microscilla sp.]